MAADSDQKDKPTIGSHRQPEQPAAAAEKPAQQAWTPAKPSQMAAGGDDDAAGGPKQPSPAADANPVGKVAEAAASLPGVGAATTIINNTTNINKEDEDKPTLGQRFLNGESGPEFGKDLGNAVGEGIKDLFGKGDKSKQAGQPTSTTEEVGGNGKQKQKPQGQEQDEGGISIGGGLGKKVGGMIGSAIGGEKGQTVGQALGKAVGGVAGQVANMAVDHARGIGGGVGGAVGGLVGGEKGASMGKDIGKGVGSAVSSVRDALAGQGVSLGPKQAPGKQSHGVK